MGKLEQQTDMSFIIEKIWNLYNQQSNHPTWRNSTSAESLEKPWRTQHTLSVTVWPLRQQYSQSDRKITKFKFENHQISAFANFIR